MNFKPDAAALPEAQRLEYCGLTFSIPRETWREALLEPDLHDLSLYLPPGPLMNTAIQLTHWTEPADLRLASRYVLLRHLPDLEFLRQNAMTAASRGCQLGLEADGPSRHSLLAAAIDNLSLGSAIVHGLRIHAGQMEMECVPHAKEWQPMPEAAWCFSICHSGSWIGRVGVNFHRDQQLHTIVASIANIQGLDSAGVARLREFDRVWPVTAVAALMAGLPPQVGVVRGIPSCLHPSRERPGFPRDRAFSRYDRTFQSSGMGLVRSQDGQRRYFELIR